VREPRVILWVGAALACLPGCGLVRVEANVFRQFQDENPSVRQAAVIEAGKTRDPRTVPYLVDRLGDSEETLRFFSIHSLEKIAGRTMGYRYYDPPREREQAVQRWRQWLKQGPKEPPATQPKDAPQ